MGLRFVAKRRSFTFNHRDILLLICSGVELLFPCGYSQNFKRRKRQCFTILHTVFRSLFSRTICYSALWAFWWGHTCRGTSRHRPGRSDGPSPPCDFGLSPTASLIMLAGIWYGCQNGGSPSPYWLTFPERTTSVMTCLDGYQMARRDEQGLPWRWQPGRLLLPGLLASLGSWL
jgi:hypothetical protein